jgi:hypothetical protein
MYMSVVCTPVLFSGEYAPPVRKGPSLRDAIGWMWRARGRLWRISWVLTLATTFASLIVLGFENTLANSTIADWVGLNAASVRVVTRSIGWNMLLYYIAFVAFDVYFHVVGVFLFYDLQARRLGSDLFARLQALRDKKGATP